MNVSDRVQSFTWITPPNDSYVLFAAVSFGPIAEEPWGPWLFQLKKHIAVIQLQKMVSHPSSRSHRSTRRACHSDLMRALFPTPVAHALARKHHRQSKFVPLRTWRGWVTHGDISRRERMGQRSPAILCDKAINNTKVRVALKILFLFFRGNLYRIVMFINTLTASVVIRKLCFTAVYKMFLNKIIQINNDLCVCVCVCA